MARICIQDSWLAYNPIEGCTGDCTYCFQRPKKLTATKVKHLFGDVKKEYDAVLDYYTKYYEKDSLTENKIPIAIGTLTDMFHVANLDFLYQFLDIHVDKKSNIPIVIITKQEIPMEFIERYKDVSFDIYIFVSASLLPENYEKVVPSLQRRLAVARVVKDRIEKEQIKNIYLIHNWRPFIHTDAMSKKEEYIKDITEIFSCSILIGLRVTNAMYKQIVEEVENPLYMIVKQKLDEDPTYFDSDAQEILDIQLAELDV